MPTQKDFKRLVRARMHKTGESYTAARLQLLRKTIKRTDVPRRGSPEPTMRGTADLSRHRSRSLMPTPEADFALLAGMSDAALSTRTGRTWAEWVRLLDAAHADEKPHREIARYVSLLGTSSWWTQAVTVGYERIRGLRAKGQRRDGAYEVNKTRTFNVPVETLFDAFAKAGRRHRWLPVDVSIRSARPRNAIRLNWIDDTRVTIGFLSKGAAKSVVTVQHEKLLDKATADAMKKAWTEHLDRLGQLLFQS